MTFEPPPSARAALDSISGPKADAIRAGIPWCDEHQQAHEDTGIEFVCSVCAAADAAAAARQETLFEISEDPQSGSVKITLPSLTDPTPERPPPPPPPPPLGVADGPFRDEMTLGEARQVLREVAEDGEICPCCGLRAQVYKRPINGTMARSLVAMYQAWGREWGDLPALRRAAQLHHSNQEGMLAWFGLIEEEAVRRPDGGRAGFWRVTELGERWVRGDATVPKYARTYGGRVLNLLGSDVTINEVLPEHFDLRAVMGGVVQET